EFTIGPQATARVGEWIRGEGLDGKSLAVLAPGAAHVTKRWPVRHWAALAARLTSRGLTPVIVGGAADRGLASQIDGVRSVAGTFSLQETGAFLARATVLERALDCRPCSAMGSSRCPMGHHRCLDDITPVEVDGAAEQLLR